ncbi:sulfurtransferase [Streptomyces lavendofoliae]|uniref:Sulfurtransferase n=1 Tax=Streptomyces lavendofoliae TaxID=67314 RepID=A0A918M759_9ACTN|nr:sulfurtransferase [Streptomyces lavendofoliae]GGU65454.1 sulfurtransferase [Streptomyces lavendofoliae]
MNTPYQGRPALPADHELPGPLVRADWLAQRLGSPGLVVLDASVGAHRGSPRSIAGARPFDIDGALSDHTGPLPHTMPDADAFTEEVRALGIDDSSTVVVYDGAGIYSSARAWWMLRAMGFDRSAVLDGGLPAWTAAGYEVRPEAPAYSGPRGDFTARPRPGLLVDSTRVSAALSEPGTAVLDARTRERFTGEAPEPRPGLRGGHMPGALNLPFGDLQTDGSMRPVDELRVVFSDVAGDRRALVFSCGSGVTACVLALGAELAGYDEIAVYDGSWSEWGLPSPLPVVTGPAGGAAGPAAGSTGGRTTGDGTTGDGTSRDGTSQDGNTRP